MVTRLQRAPCVRRQATGRSAWPPVLVTRRPEERFEWPDASLAAEMVPLQQRWSASPASSAWAAWSPAQLLPDRSLDRVQPYSLSLPRCPASAATRLSRQQGAEPIEHQADWTAPDELVPRPWAASVATVVGLQGRGRTGQASKMIGQSEACLRYGRSQLLNRPMLGGCSGPYCRCQTSTGITQMSAIARSSLRGSSPTECSTRVSVRAGSPAWHRWSLSRSGSPRHCGSRGRSQGALEQSRRRTSPPCR